MEEKRLPVDIDRIVMEPRVASIWGREINKPGEQHWVGNPLPSKTELAAGWNILLEVIDHLPWITDVSYEEVGFCLEEIKGIDPELPPMPRVWLTMKAGSPNSGEVTAKVEAIPLCDYYISDLDDPEIFPSEVAKRIIGVLGLRLSAMFGDSRIAEGHRTEQNKSMAEVAQELMSVNCKSSDTKL